MAKAKKQFVVIGLGRFGMSLCKTLHKEGANVLAIDEDSDRVNEIEPFCTQAICADATDERVLERLGINNLDVAVVGIGKNTEASIFVTLMCKQMGIKQVIAKAQSERHEHVLEKIGADMVISPEDAMGEKLALALVKPTMLEVLSLTDNFRIIEIKTPTKWCGKSLIDLDLRNAENISIILIKRGEEIIVTPAGNCVLMEGDTLVIAGTIADTKRVSAKATHDILDEFE